MKEKDDLLIDYLRVSLTDQCDLNCIYCGNSKRSLPPLTQLPLDILFRMISELVKCGIKKIRLTGGEPLLREGIVSFIHRLSQLPFSPDVLLTTSLHVDREKIDQINRSNINGINVSLDSLDRDVYRKITGHGDLDTVKKNLEHVQIKKIKINTVLLKGINDHEVEDIINYTVSRNFIPRFIECMETKPSNKDLFISNSLIIRQLINKRILMKDSRRGIPGSAAEYYSLRGSDNKTVGFISPVSNRFCKSCNRLRLTSNGYLYLCLFNQKPENISELLKGASTDEEVSDRFKALLLKKAPERMNNPVDMRSMGG